MRTVDVVGAADYLLLLDLRVADVQPVGEVFADLLLQQVHALLDLEGLPQLDHDAVEAVEVVAVVGAAAGEMDDGQDLFFLG